MKTIKIFSTWLIEWKESPYMKRRKMGVCVKNPAHGKATHGVFCKDCSKK